MWFYLFVLFFLISLMLLGWHLFYTRKMDRQIKLITSVLTNISKTDRQQKIVIPEQEPLSAISFSINEIVENKNQEIYHLKQIEQAQKNLLNDLSHDIRTPLTSLIGYLEALDHGYLSKKEFENYLPLLLKKAEQLQLLTDQLFIWFKLETSKGERQEELHTQNISELTRTIVSSWIPVFEKNDFRYQIELPEQDLLVSIDEIAYTRIVDNILKNCLDHSQGSWLKLVLQENEETVSLIIQDNGIGIPEEQQSFIFQRLYKGDPARSRNSSGLGLAIVEEFVKRLGGEITVKSRIGEGALFKVDLPKRAEIEKK